MLSSYLTFHNILISNNINIFAHKLGKKGQAVGIQRFPFLAECLPTELSTGFGDIKQASVSPATLTILGICINNPPESKNPFDHAGLDRVMFI